MENVKHNVKHIDIGNVKLGRGLPLVLIAGPCVIESRTHTLEMAERIALAASSAGLPFVFKTSYDKANRSSGSSFRGPGLSEGLEIVAEVKARLGLPVLLDVHTPEETIVVAGVADCLQVPAFLCRQTDFVRAVARAGKPVNIKKGQFLAPWDMKNIIEKIEAEGNGKICLTERGVSFGYNNLVVDFRSLVIMAQTGYPVVFDATHSVQMPGGLGHATGGESRMVPYLSRAAAATGIDGLFLEVHDDPGKALCDGPNQLSLELLSGLLGQVKGIHGIFLDTLR